MVIIVFYITKHKLVSGWTKRNIFLEINIKNETSLQNKRDLYQG